jgi:serine/threonine protein kinase/predicted Zn-dependent protease
MATSLPGSGPPGPSALLTETMQAPVRELTTGSTFAGRYQVIEELGRGGMGRVYKVHDTELNEKIALKLLRPEVAADPDTVERFRNELKSARLVVHKNVCRMFDIGRAEGAPYITMEYVHGEDLKRLIRKIGQMPAGRTASIARQIAEGLAEAHGHGIVHRDLKPQNIMVDEGGNVRIMDFGIARSLERKGITGAGVMIGTPEYMSPEQVEGKAVDARSDIYSLGIILYEMMTGRVPFEGDTPFTVGVKHKSEKPRDPLELNPAIPQDLGRLILSCLEKEKEKRFQSAGEFLDELGRIEQALPTTERMAPKTRPHTSKQITVSFDVKKVAVPAVAAVLVIAAALVLWLVVLKKHIVRPQTGKPQLAVIYFKNNTGEKDLDIWRTALPELIISDLSQSRYLEVVSDSQIYGVLRGMNLEEAKNFSSEDLKAVAERTGATHVLQGALTKAGTSYRINTTLLDAGTQKILSAEMVQGEGEASFHTMVDELGLKIKAGLRISSQEIASDIDLDVGKITTASSEAYKLYSQGRNFHMARDYKSSIALMEKAVAIDPGFAMAYRSMAAAYSNMGFRAQADACRQKAMELKDRISDRERWLIEGTFYMRTERTYDKALESIEKVVQLYPDDPVANNQLGLIHGYLEDYEQSLKYYLVCVRRPGAPYLYYGNAALAYANLGQYGKALELLEEFLKTSPESGAAHLDRADKYIYEGRYDLALAEADKAFALAPSDINVFATAGQAAMLKGDFVRAEAEFQKLVSAAVKANMPWRRGSLAVFYASQGKYGKALEQIALATEQARRVGEPSWLAQFNFFGGFVLGSAGRSDDALKASEQAYRIAAEGENLGMTRNILWGKGVAYLGMKATGQAQRTADELKALIEQNPNKKSIRLYQNLQAQIEIDQGNFANAVENAKAAVAALHPQSSSSMLDGFFYDTLAKAYEGKGDLENARKAYEGLQGLTYGRFASGNLYALSFYRLGLIAEKLGDKAGARANFQKFLEIWKDADSGLPEPADARKRLAAL